MLDPLLTLPETAKILAVSRPTVSRLIAAHELPAVRIGRRIGVRPCDVERYIVTHLTVEPPTTTFNPTISLKDLRVTHA